ncbi:MAG: ATP-binding protein [Acidimicrobiia bacterium]|nr:ATP-binding protein [Acidimicrobiia bacterium]MYJ13950.1 ATP-binding protein [Acidimicrobiia bacterium]
MSCTLTPDGYRPRVADAAMAAALEAAPIVVVEGVKGCGKTWTGLRHAASKVMLAEEPSARRGAEVVPRHVLSGVRPRLVDEWQVVPSIWDVARHVVDEGREVGCLILTGSARPADSVTRHSGAGRVRRIRMRPMSLAESGESDGSVSLGALLDGGVCEAAAPAGKVADIAELVCRGGWPRNLGRTAAAAQQLVEGYLDEMARLDLPEASGTRHNPTRVLRLLASLARNTATTASLSTLARDVAGDPPLSWSATAAYLDGLERIFLVEDLPVWPVRLRTRARLQQSPKRHFVDPSLAAAILGASPARLLDDLETLGLLFESLVVRDLRVYAEANRARVYHARSSSGHEFDAVIERRDGAWIPVEVKLGEGRVDDAAQSLLRAGAEVDTTDRGEPANMLVVTAAGYAYRRPDGVSVTPIGALGP